MISIFIVREGHMVILLPLPRQINMYPFVKTVLLIYVKNRNSMKIQLVYYALVRINSLNR